MTGLRVPAAVLGTALLAVLVAALLPLAIGALLGDGPDAGPPSGAVLDGADRRALGALPLQRGAAPPPVDPAVDLADPQAVARAYLADARSARPDDDGRTRRRAAGYAAPGSPPATVGVLVLDPPPPGRVRTAAVTALELLAQDGPDRRRGYRATVTTTTGSPSGTGTPPGGTPPGAAPPVRAVAVTTAWVVLARQPDGHWLVTADTPDVPEGDD